MQAMLMLADGTIFKGEAAGASGEVHGEVVCNTSITGYQEVLTDKANHGKIVVMTYPLIGNYGVINDDAQEQFKPTMGFVVHNLCEEPSNWRSTNKLSDFLSTQSVVTVTGIDTRALARHLRKYGTMKGAVISGNVDQQVLLTRINAAPASLERDLVSEVSTSQPYVYCEGEGAHVVVVDLGVDQNTLRYLRADNNKVTMLPAYTSSKTIMNYQPSVVVYTNGPGDPMMLKPTFTTVQELLGKVPLFGIGLGHQVLGLALGASTFKMTHGHRGNNQPVQDLASGRVQMTSQNHGFAVVKESLPNELVVSHINLHDGTVEGMYHGLLPLASIQYQPGEEERFCLPAQLVSRP